ncbi:hypothetical protein C4J81_03420 [Deltaproteobacteria bacterium Smac51]|nr:hypothetical protein C4J81_03420 [Deltaproteobacteria bacterium Smac51]
MSLVRKTDDHALELARDMARNIPKELAIRCLEMMGKAHWSRWFSSYREEILDFLISTPDNRDKRWMGQSNRGMIALAALACHHYALAFDEAVEKYCKEKTDVKAQSEQHKLSARYALKYLSASPTFFPRESIDYYYSLAAEPFYCDGSSS